MKTYPEILGSSKAPLGEQCIAFVKYDGSNLRWEWSAKKGWYKFGTRTRLFDASDEIFGPAIPLFQDTLGQEIARRIKDIEKGIQNAIVFTEFFGPNSFTGLHKTNDPKELRLFDVNLYKRGIMNPRDFVKYFGDLSFAAQVIYEGKLNQQFIDDVRNGNYPVVEGVVAKGKDFMIKIKTNTYLAKLKTVYRDGWKNYWE
jgi:hypothetical protein